MEPLTPSDTTATAVKRKREDSLSTPTAAPAAKATKSATQLSINYLARQTQEDLPLLTKEDTLPNMLQLLTAYSNVLERHESLASNLGARPLGPILIKRFERCFDAPPKVVASHHKGSASHPEESGHAITWLEVIEFARAHPGQFTLSTFSEGKRVCQFYYPQKQLRVQISEEDFLFINSGRCQELIPPLPIWEDEEKEVGTCDVLETKLKELTNVADMVAARTRQLSHRLKGRRSAILERRAEGGSGTPAKANAVQTTTAPGSGLTSGTVASARPLGDGDASAASFASVRSELLKHFEGLPQNQSAGQLPSRHLSIYPELKHESERAEGADSTLSSLSPGPARMPQDLDVTPAQPSSTSQVGGGGHRPSVSTGTHNYNAGHAPSKHNFSRPLPPALESSQPFRPLCQAHMDGLPRGARVMPPCDRCRRLRMDCVKNLTSCAGCTKKHARCHWRDVSREELGDLDHVMDAAFTDGDDADGAQGSNGLYGYDQAMNDYQNDANPDEFEDSDDEDSNPLEDLEALGEKEDQRERELAVQMEVDEEGLRQARELARQGREAAQLTGVNGTPTSDLEDDSPDVVAPAAKDDGPADIEASESAASTAALDAQHQPQPTVSTNADTKPSPQNLHAPSQAPDTGPTATARSSPPTTAATAEPSSSQTSEPDKAPAFIPLYAEAEAQAHAPVHGGFHAVNKPNVSSTTTATTTSGNGAGWSAA
ncbi:hypothetical protein B0A50_07025 [Salinomyces thailandicus]|uniref:Zn(2)-C6 fungal-type domain-containing protein n=1 Tax=Salinomyces thailandicus TaxID=706561 RepID=A0A4U0TP03_9PEZI|nr:hypothetical protein B0A50_07025 [Salinomyces thailandica]